MIADMIFLPLRTTFFNGRWALLICSVLGGIVAGSANPIAAQTAIDGDSRSGVEEQVASRWDYPAIENSISIRDGKSRQRLSWPALLDQLQSADIVFLGETHDDDTTHRLQLAIYESLLRAKEGKVVLALEMFERDVQAELDSYLQGTIDEATFLAAARPWGTYREAYRPLIERAKTDGRPVVAANFPRPLIMKIGQGSQGIESLSAAEKKFAPEKLLPNSDLYWKRADNATRSHSMFMTIQTDPASRLTSTQSLWDNAMGEACVTALKEYPEHQVLHLNGGFHSEYWEGTVGQVLQRRPEAKVKTVAIRPTSSPLSAEMIGQPVADFVIYVEERAKNLNDGNWRVMVSREQGYQLHLPVWASTERPAPLLIWLSDDGLSSADNLAYWKSRLGDEVAIAVIEPTHRQRERDLSLAGRWFWPDRFPEDIGTGSQAIELAWQYLLNRFPVDPQRVCLAGEGTGGTLCAATTLMTSRMSVAALAFGPKQYSKIKDFPLPLLEDWGKETPPQRKLTIIGASSDRDWWQEELKAYQEVEIETAWLDAETDRWRRTDFRMELLRRALQLTDIAADANPVDTAEAGLSKDAPSPQKTDDVKRKYLVARHGSVKEVMWLEMLADRLSNPQQAVTWIGPADTLTADETKQWERLDYTVTRSQILAGALPLCPGPFGGTTVLVISSEQAVDLASWIELEANDPLNRRSRFHRTRIAVADVASEQDSRYGLGNVLSKLNGENRKNVLIVPAEFYAGEQAMGNLYQQAKPLEDQMTLQWLPGLGGEVAKRAGE